MKIKIRIDSLETVSEELRGFYEEDSVNGGFILQAEPDAKGLAIGPLASLRGKLEESQKKEIKVKGMLLTKDDDSLWSLEEVNGIVQELAHAKEANTLLLSKNKGGDELLQQQVAAAKGPLQKENTELKAKVDAYRKTVYAGESARQVDSVLKAMRPKKEWEDLLRQEISRHVSVEEIDGNLKSTFIDPSTGVALFSSGHDNDGPMDLKEFAESTDIRTRYAQCLEGDGKVGANIKPDDTSRNKQRTADKKFGAKDVAITSEDADDFTMFVEASNKATKQGGTVVIVD